MFKSGMAGHDLPMVERHLVSDSLTLSDATARSNRRRKRTDAILLSEAQMIPLANGQILYRLIILADREDRLLHFLAPQSTDIIFVHSREESSAIITNTEPDIFDDVSCTPT
jgi:hypothetical protein